MQLQNRELQKRFVSDYKLPIPLINEEYFQYYLKLYESDYGALTKYNDLLENIRVNYGNDPARFLEEYYDIRENIIQSVLSSPAFLKFNNMDMNVYAIKDRPNVTSKNIYNQNNAGKFFISVDIKKANFQTLKNIDKEIVLGADTYEDFIGKFTDSDYIKASKYTREVIFGKLNPKRHITAEKYFINKIYQEIISQHPELKDKTVSLATDEMVFLENPNTYQNPGNAVSLQEDIKRIAKENGFDVHVEFFFLQGYNLVFKESRSVRKTFYHKDFVLGDSNFKLIAAPLPYHAMIYKLFKGLPLEEIDYHFDYEGMDARFCEEFDIEQLQ